jgi:hypothetical protein
LVDGAHGSTRYFCNAIDRESVLSLFFEAQTGFGNGIDQRSGACLYRLFARLRQLVLGAWGGGRVHEMQVLSSVYLLVLIFSFSINDLRRL